MMATINGIDEHDIPMRRPEKNDDPLNPANMLPFSKEIGPGTALTDEPKKKASPRYNFTRRDEQHPMVEVQAPEVKPEDVVPGNIVKIPAQPEI